MANHPQNSWRGLFAKQQTKAVPVRESGDYGYGFTVDGTSWFRGTAAQKSYLFYITGDRVAAYVATGDSNDAYLRISGNNYAANDSNFILRGINTIVNNRSGGTMGRMESLISVQNKSGGTIPTLLGLTVKSENYGTNATEFGVIDAIAASENQTATLSYGIRIRNDERSSVTNVQSALLITSHASSGGFAYGVDLNGGTFNTAHIRLSKPATEDVVIAVGDFTDGGDSGFAPGSIGLDTTNGLLFYSDSSGVWQQVAAA